MEKTEQTVTVLVSGAGPVGLMAANELRRRGIACRIIDQNSGRSVYSKALVVHAPTMEVLDLMGLTGEFTRLGYPITKVYLDFGHNHPLSVSFAGLDSQFPYILSLPQSDTEAILETNLKQLGTQVERQTELVDFEQTETGVTAHLRRVDGQEETLQVEYLINAEGAHSQIRHKLGLPFDGKAYDFVALLGDVEIEGDLANGGMHIYAVEAGAMFLVALPNGRWRVIAVDFNKQQPERLKQELSLAELQETVDALSPVKLTLKDPVWLSHFSSPLRIVPQFRAGRVFLMGDAAHVHSPAGGQGMNMGLQDAYNLCWKLAMVLKEQAPVELLETYHPERHTFDSKLMKLTDLLIGNATQRNSIITKTRNALVPALTKLAPLQQMVRQNLTGIGLDYREGKQKAGMRVPNLELFANGQPVVWLYDFLKQSSNYILLAYTEKVLDKAEFEKLTSMLHAVEASSNGSLRAGLVLAEAFATIRETQFPILIDTKEQFQACFKPEGDSLWLVRPDARLAFELKGFDLSALQVALQPWVKLGAAQAVVAEPIGATSV